MDVYAVRLVDGNRLLHHQEIFLVIINLKGCYLTGIMVQADKMPAVWEDGNGLGVIPADLRLTHRLQFPTLLINRIYPHRIGPGIGTEQIFPIRADFHT